MAEAVRCALAEARRLRPDQRGVGGLREFLGFESWRLGLKRYFSLDQLSLTYEMRYRMNFSASKDHKSYLRLLLYVVNTLYNPPSSSSSYKVA